MTNKLPTLTCLLFLLSGTLAHTAVPPCPAHAETRITLHEQIKRMGDQETMTLDLAIPFPFGKPPTEAQLLRDLFEHGLTEVSDVEFAWIDDEKPEKGYVAKISVIGTKAMLLKLPYLNVATLANRPEPEHAYITGGGVDISEEAAEAAAQKFFEEIYAKDPEAHWYRGNLVGDAPFGGSMIIVRVSDIATAERLQKEYIQGFNGVRIQFHPGHALARAQRDLR